MQRPALAPAWGNIQRKDPASRTPCICSHVHATSLGNDDSNMETDLSELGSQDLDEDMEMEPLLDESGREWMRVIGTRGPERCSIGKITMKVL